MTADLIGTGDVARLLGRTLRTVSRQAADGVLPTVTQLGERGAYLFDRAAIVAIRDAEIAAERARLDALEAEGVPT